MDDVPRHRSSSDNNDDDTDHPGETTTGFSPQRLSSVLPLGEEERVTTRDGRNESLGSVQQLQQQPLASHHTRASKRQRQPANDPLAATSAKRSSSLNAPRAASSNAPLAASWNAAAATGIVPLNAPLDSIPVADMFHGSQPSSSAHRFESMGLPQPQQQRRDVQWYSNPHDGLSVAADQESTFEQWRQQQMTRSQRGPDEHSDPPNLQPSHAPVATHFASQLEARSQSVATASEEKQSSTYSRQSHFPPTGSMFRYAAEEKQSSPPFPQSFLPVDTPASMLAQYNQQLRQQRPPQQQRQHVLPQQQQQLLPQQQQRQQLLTQQQQRQMAYDNMAPVSGTHTTGAVAAASAFDMRSPLTFQLALPPLPNIAGILLPETTLPRHHGSTTIRPRFRVADFMSQLRAEPRTFASLNDEPLSASMLGQSSLHTDTTSLALLYQQQQQQQQQQYVPHDTANQGMAAPLGTETDATATIPTPVAANMRLPLMSRPMPTERSMQNRPIPRLSSSTLSPLEMLYLSNRLNASQPTVDSWPQLAPPQQNSIITPQPRTTQQTTARGPQPTFPLTDSTSLLTDWSESVSTLSEDQQPTIHLRQSPSPVRTAASNLAFLNQLQQRQMERQQELSYVTTNQQLAAPHRTLDNTMAPSTATEAAVAATAALMRSAIEDPTPRPTSTTLSPLETQYWLHRLNSSTLTAQPTAPPWPTIPPPQPQHRPQISQQVSNQATLAQGGLLNLPMDNTSSVSSQTNQRFSDAFQPYASRNDPALVATSRATEATAESTRSIPDPILPLPAFLARSSDSSLMSEHQTYLRCHIQLFCATMDDVTAPVRGRTKNIQLGQVGIQCCHCAHLPLSDRINGAVYFPATTQGIYQAALNMGAMHLQCGRCPQMPDAMKQHFAKLLGAKNMPSMVGRKYWAKTAIEMFGLVDTEHGIFVDSRAPAAA